MESKSTNLPLTSESLQALSAMPVQPQTSSRSQPKTQRTARSEASGTARSAKVETARSGAEAMDSFRSTMSNFLSFFSCFCGAIIHSSSNSNTVCFFIYYSESDHTLAPIR